MPSYFFSPSDGGFYRSDLHGGGMPQDVLAIDDERHAELLSLHEQGFDIQAGVDGLPMALKADISVSVPALCSPAQGLIALFVLKRISEADVLTAISRIPDPVQRYTAQIGYQRATVWDRVSPTMQAMAQLLQLSEEDLDALYSYAVTVQV